MVAPFGGGHLLLRGSVNERAYPKTAWLTLMGGLASPQQEPHGFFGTVFFIQDAMRFPDLFYAIKQEPDEDL